MIPPHPDLGPSRPKILLVDDVPELLAALARALAPRFEVETALCAEEALRILEQRGPFAVVVSDHELEGMKGVELLGEVHRRFPETKSIMLTGVVDVDVAIRALHAGRILRFLEKPCPQGELLAAVEDCVEEHRRHVHARVKEGELEVTRTALWDFNAALTGRIREQTQALHQLNRFVGDLNSAESLPQIAKLAADAASSLLHQRAVRIELGQSLGELVACASAGGAMSAERHVEEIIASEGPVGVLVVDTPSHGARAFGAAQRELLRAVASATSVAVYNVLRRQERDEAQHATILALARLAEQRDNETGKHLERVSLLCRLIAEGLRESGHHAALITDAWIRDLVRSAPLHDIGKVGIPDAILLKPSKLTQPEWAIMKRHTEIGAETLRAVIADNKNQRFLQMSLDIAWCHHEHWDGGGYPRGLAGQEIPLSARIVALADVYDALTTVRPYKHAWPHARAIEWIRQGSGTHFDPDATAAFLTCEQQADFVRARLADSPDEILPRITAAKKVV